MRIGTPLDLLLRDVVPSETTGLFDIVTAVAAACRDISLALREGAMGKAGTERTGTENAFGDKQLQADLHSHQLFMQRLRNCRAVATASSEEAPHEETLSTVEDARYSVAFDPLDGSSIVDCNWSVGTIASPGEITKAVDIVFGIWHGRRLLGVSGRELACSGCAVYGPKTTLYLAFSAPRCVHELTLQASSPPSAGASWTVTRTCDSIGVGRLFAPANMRAAQSHAGYAELLDYYMRQRYTLRYTGGMVPDIVQLLVKGRGVFVSPACADAPAKLRLLYEALPMALLVEAAGGASSAGRGSLLDSVVKACDDRTPVCVGSKEEVDRYEKYCPA